jgi:hypothetical protein
MLKGPRGERRPADVIGNAVHLMRIATGEVAETLKAKDAASRALPTLVLGRVAASEEI